MSGQEHAANLASRRAHDPVNRYAAIEEMYRTHEEELYLDLVRYSRGEEPNDLRPGTVGMGWAEEAKRLIEEDPSLLLPQNRDDLLRKVKGHEPYSPTKPRPGGLIKVGLYECGKSPGKSFNYQCAVCGADAEAFPVCAEGRDEVGPVRVCERCLEAGNLDERLANRAADLEARAAIEQNAELEVEARDARSLMGRLDVPTIEAWRWLASRDAAAEAVDVKTCEVFRQHVQMMDPYGCDVAMAEEYDCVGGELFVVSNATDGKVWIGDLPDEKCEELYERIKREPASSDDSIPDDLIPF